MISAPSISSNAGIYRIAFQSEQVTFQVERISDKRDTVGEFTVHTQVPGLDPYIAGPEKVNLVSGRSQAGFVKSCLENQPSLKDLEWDRILSKVCREVLKLHREGAPIIVLADHHPGDKLQARILFNGRTFHAEGQHIVEFGDGGTSKTLVVDFQAVLVATGLSRCGFETEPGNVLLIDYESTVDEKKERIESICKGLGIEVPKNIYYRFASGPFATEIEPIQRQCLEKEINYLVIDSAGPACGGKSEDSDQTIPFFVAARSLRISVRTIAHIAKNDARVPFGSVYWRNYPRATYRITSSQKPGDSEYTIGISHTKVNWGQRLRPFGLRVRFDGGAVYFEQADLKEDPELAKNLSVRDQIIFALQDGKHSTGHIADRLNLSEGSVRTTLNRFKDEPFIKIGSEWGLLGEYSS